MSSLLTSLFRMTSDLAYKGGMIVDVLSEKLFEHFPGKIVRKDLTKKIKEGAKTRMVKTNIKLRLVTSC